MVLNMGLTILNRNFTRLTLLYLFMVASLSPSHAAEPAPKTNGGELKTFIVGVEDVDYFPHYDIKREGPDKGVAIAILNLFAKQMDYQFVYQEYPIRRLRKNLITHQTIDFSYPDHPRWSEDIKRRAHIIYSDPVEHVVSGTLVPKARDGVSADEIKTLAMIRGFTPTLWAKETHSVQLLEVSDAESALKMVLLGRADGADVGLSVANYHLRKLGAEGELVMTQSLANARFPFHLSTINFPEVVDQFNQFLRDNTEQIATIKSEYEVLESLE